MQVLQNIIPRFCNALNKIKEVQKLEFIYYMTSQLLGSSILSEK